MADSDTDLRVLARRARQRFSRADGHTPLRLFSEDVYARSALAYAAEIAQIRDLPKVCLIEPEQIGA